MFCTLKQNGLADQSYTFETTTPPFSKKREGRLAKIACTKCRISKLKCSGEPHGCQRCLAKKIDCRYPNPSRGGNNHKKARTQAPAPPTPPETPETQSPSRPSSVHVDAAVDDDFFTVASGHEMAYSGTLDDLDLSLEGFEMPQFTNLDNLHGLLSDSEYMDPSDAMTPWNQSITYASDTMNSPWNSTPEREDVFFNADNSVSPVTSPPEKPDSGCSCFSQAAATYEAIETAIWGQGELRTNTDDVLQSQKKALSECEELLECQRCSAQSAYIMLLLSMCRRILATLEELRRGDAGNNPTHNPDARKRRRHGEDSDADDESRTRGYGISIRNRQLDDDDEHLVLQSLVAARAARLDRLLSSLDKVVSEHGWPAHKGLVQDLQGRLVGNSFDVGKIRRAWTG